MKRSGPPQRKRAFVRKTGLSRSPRPPIQGGAGERPSDAIRPVRGISRRPEPGEAEWKVKRHGHCRVCNTYGRVVLHHILDEQTIRKTATPEQIAAGIVWDQDNALLIGAPIVWAGRCLCHASHHVYGLTDTRIPFAKVPPAAQDFAVRLLGEGPSLEYFRRHYKDAP